MQFGMSLQRNEPRLIFFLLSLFLLSFSVYLFIHVYAIIYVMYISSKRKFDDFEFKLQYNVPRRETIRLINQIHRYTESSFFPFPFRLLSRIIEIFFIRKQTNARINHEEYLHKTSVDYKRKVKNS